MQQYGAARRVLWTDTEVTPRAYAWCSTVYLVFGLQVTVVGVIGLFLMVTKDIHDFIQDMNTVYYWAPIMGLMLVTLVYLHSYYDESPQHVYAQFAYLVTWGYALAAVAVDYYPGFGVLIIPGLMYLGMGFIFLAAYARWTMAWGYHASFIACVTAIPFQVTCWANAGQFEGDDWPPAVPFLVCNMFMALVEIYLVWKTKKSLEAHGTDQVWVTTADLLLAGFAVPCIFPCQMAILHAGWNFCGSRYFEAGKTEAQDHRALAPDGNKMETGDEERAPHARVIVT